MPVITCCDKKFVFPYSDELMSEYIRDVVEAFNDEDLIIPIPDKYCSVIDNYISFIYGERTPIVSNDKLLLTFQLCTLLVDDSYFNYLLEQVFDNWSDMSRIVYNNFDDDLKWAFFLQSPYDFIPNYLLDNELFMSQWEKFNQNVIIKVNQGDDIYYNNIESINDSNNRTIQTYHTINGKEVGYKKQIEYYGNSDNIETEKYWFDGKEDGIWRWWYNIQTEINDQQTEGILREQGLHFTEFIARRRTLECEGHYVNGKEHGVWRQWYNNQREINDQQTTGILPQGESLRHIEDGLLHTLKLEQYYVNGELDGISRQWYDNNQHTLKLEEHYVKGKLNGVWREWYNTQREINDQQTDKRSEGILREKGLHQTLECEGHYVNGKKHGVWRWWYNNDQHTLKLEEHYVNDKLDGILRQWFVDNQQTTGIHQREGLRHIEDGLRHTLEYEGNFINGKEDGLWRRWYNDDQHTLASEGYYVNGKKHGQYVIFNIDGSIASDDVYINGIKQQ